MAAEPRRTACRSRKGSARKAGVNSQASNSYYIDSILPRTHVQEWAGLCLTPTRTRAQRITRGARQANQQQRRRRRASAGVIFRIKFMFAPTQRRQEKRIRIHLCCPPLAPKAGAACKTFRTLTAESVKQRRLVRLSGVLQHKRTTRPALLPAGWVFGQRP